MARTRFTLASGAAERPLPRKGGRIVFRGEHFTAERNCAARRVSRTLRHPGGNLLTFVFWSVDPDLRGQRQWVRGLADEAFRMGAGRRRRARPGAGPGRPGPGRSGPSPASAGRGRSGDARRCTSGRSAGRRRGCPGCSRSGRGTPAGTSACGTGFPNTGCRRRRAAGCGSW